MSVTPFYWNKDHLQVLDQRLLPHQIKYLPCRSPKDIAQVIRSMAVRGAPAIGCCAAYGMALALKRNGIGNPIKVLEKAGVRLKAARPTAVNLAWAVNRMMELAKKAVRDGRGLFSVLLEASSGIQEEDVQNNKSMGWHGAKLLKKDSIVLTHCNTGALATAGVGTALGVIRQAFSQGKIKKVFVDETRPYLQGARLTAWELGQERIPHELITDNMAGFFMKTEKVDAVMVGCDRVVANGDTANKIGTYSLAILARYHKIPFYVAMPISTLDPNLKNGDEIPIEERSPDEVVKLGGVRIAPTNTKARHPAFDVTPASLITAFITERGVVRPPYKKTLKKLKTQ